MVRLVKAVAPVGREMHLRIPAQKIARPEDQTRLCLLNFKFCVYIRCLSGHSHSDEIEADWSALNEEDEAC